jgi:transcriptional regulator of arginine metabolism
MTKNLRQGQILKLIRGGSIFTQEELARALKEKGIETTQVTLSRDMRELGLVKTAEGYRQIERDTPNLQFATLAAEFLQDIRQAQNQVVLRTAPGHASSVAVALDDEEWPEVVGTIAGDDTILVICPDAPTALQMRTKLLDLLKS